VLKPVHSLVLWKQNFILPQQSGFEAAAATTINAISARLAFLIRSSSLRVAGSCDELKMEPYGLQATR
jgi:hypothetical protein